MSFTKIALQSFTNDEQSNLHATGTLAAGDIVYNSERSTLQLYRGDTGSWVEIGGGSIAPLSGYDVIILAHDANTNLGAYGGETIVFSDTATLIEGPTITLQGAVIVEGQQYVNTGSVNTTIANSGPAGTSTTPAKWLKISDDSGNHFVIPAFSVSPP